MNNNTSGVLSITLQPNVSGAICRSYLPVRKNDVVAVSYSAAGTTNQFRFVYAQGSYND